MQTLTVKNSTGISEFGSPNENKSTLYNNKKKGKVEVDVQQCYNGTEEHPEYTRNHVLKKKKERSIKLDLKNAGFPPEIVVKADEIYSQMVIGSKRGIKKRLVLFFCARTAYDSMGIPEDPSQIAEKCGITRSDISRANSLCAPSKTTFKAPLVNHEPKNYIDTFYQKMINLGMLLHNDAFLKAMHEICEEALVKDTTLREEKPHTMAAAVIVYYLDLNNLMLEKSKYSEMFGFSEMTITKIRNKIERAYSS